MLGEHRHIYSQTLSARPGLGGQTPPLEDLPYD